MVVVTVENGSWLLPPQRALWVPSWFDHESVARKSGALKTLPLNGDDSIVLPRTVQLLTMSSFFRAVLIEALREAHAAADTTRSHCLRSLLLGEFAAEPASSPRLPAPRTTPHSHHSPALLAAPLHVPPPTHSP